jgi:hypothetical protein
VYGAQAQLTIPLFYAAVTHDLSVLDWMHRVKVEYVADRFREGSIVVPGHQKANLEPPLATVDDMPSQPNLKVLGFWFKTPEDKLPSGIQVPDVIQKAWYSHPRWGPAFVSLLEEFTAEFGEPPAAADTSSNRKRASTAADLEQASPKKPKQVDPSNLVDFEKIKGVSLMDIPLFPAGGKGGLVGTNICECVAASGVAGQGVVVA